MSRLDDLRANIRKVFLGNQSAVDKLLVCLLARGHVLIEDVPGVGKTLLATALARSLDCHLSRIQLTPDMLPSDVLGVTVWDQNKSQFTFKPGPIFANIVLADEINRTTPRTQSALLEAMNEGQVSIDGQTRKLPPPFLVVATQNPYEFEGTYFLPESQLDRFLMRLTLGYPSPQDEARILEVDPLRTQLGKLQPVMSAAELVALQEQVPKIKVDPALRDYVVRIAAATRRHEQIRIGVSTRGALALLQAAQATALLAERAYLVPEDITSNVISVCTHRVVTRALIQDQEGLTPPRIMQQILESEPSPV
ncbi:MAG: AAA family ATPase [Phycisphaeraceae bacterium]|nr:AAA family ATPase [Phycisphaeraceae bacterium]